MSETKVPAAKSGERASRRRFLKLMAAGSAAVLAKPLEAATTPEKKPAAKSPALPPEISAEIKSQKDYLARTLSVIRDFELPAGSEPACVFLPLVSPRRTPGGGKR